MSLHSRPATWFSASVCSGAPEELQVKPDPSSRRCPWGLADGACSTRPLGLGVTLCASSN